MELFLSKVAEIAIYVHFYTFPCISSLFLYLIGIIILVGDGKRWFPPKAKIFMGYVFLISIELMLSMVMIYKFKENDVLKIGLVIGMLVLLSTSTIFFLTKTFQYCLKRT